VINVIKNVLCSCNYQYIEETNVNHHDDEFQLFVFRSETTQSQVFLVLSIKESQLLEIGFNNDFMIDVVTSFKETTIYKTEMDKNTSLVFGVERDISSTKLNKVRVEIEDDPYYFKKYVFSFTEAEAKQFYQLSKQYSLSDIEVIQKYILDTKNFTEFKDNYENKEIYRMISDLLIKIPVIPISFQEKEKIKAVEQYMEETNTYESEKMKNLDNIITELLGSEETEEEDESLTEALLEMWDIKL